MRGSDRIHPGSLRYAAGMCLDSIRENLQKREPIDGLVCLFDAIAYPLSKEDQEFRAAWREAHVTLPEKGPVPQSVRLEEVRILWDLLFRKGVVATKEHPIYPGAGVFHGDDEGGDDSADSA